MVVSLQKPRINREQRREDDGFGGGYIQETEQQPEGSVHYAVEQ